MKFGYVKLPAKDGKFIELPLVEVTLDFGRYFCLVDSGADFCYFHGKIGELLGLDIESGEIMEGRGITGQEFKVYLHKIKFKIGGWDYEAKIGFSYELGVPFGILGREGFFNLFKVCFDHPKKEIELKRLG